MPKTRKNHAGGILPSKVRDPFAAVPLIAPGVEACRDRRKFVHVQKKLMQKKGFLGVLAQRLGLDRTTKASLDEKGSYFWQQIDGEKDLMRIERKFSRHFETNRKESRQAIVQFTKTLMERGLIILKVSGNPGKSKSIS